MKRIGIRTEVARRALFPKQYLFIAVAGEFSVNSTTSDVLLRFVVVTRNNDSGAKFPMLCSIIS